MKEIPTKESILALLSGIPDPEIPVITILELGVIRDARISSEGTITIDLTPTYSGCPAMKQMEREVIDTLRAHGFSKVVINTVHSPAWTTDWLSEEAKKKLKDFGIAPPVGTDKEELVTIGKRKIVCPYCNSEKTELRSTFGATACKSLYYCMGCAQPFEYFKSI